MIKEPEAVTLLPRNLEVDLLKTLANYSLITDFGSQTINEYFYLPFSVISIVDKIEKSRTSGLKKLVRKLVTTVNEYCD